MTKVVLLQGAANGVGFVLLVDKILDATDEIFVVLTTLVLIAGRTRPCMPSFCSRGSMVVSIDGVVFSTVVILPALAIEKKTRAATRNSKFLWDEAWHNRRDISENKIEN